MAPKYIDSHAHLFLKDYKEDIDNVISNAKRSGVEYFVVPGTDLKTSQEAVNLAEHHEEIFACVGCHPHEAAKTTDLDLEEIGRLSENRKVVAVGEIGLDFHYNLSPHERQCEMFAAQIQIAVRRNLPVVVHTRESMKEAFSIIQNAVNNNSNWKENKGEYKRGVFHCFSGTAEEAAYLHSLGFYISYPGIVTFRKSESIETIKKVGIRDLLLETDSPYMTPVPLRGKRNEPANIIYIGRKIAEILNISEEEVANVTSNNAIDLFGLPKKRFNNIS
jgi:TatD DNase family protein